MNTDKATLLLIDAMIMMQDIRKARMLPAFGAVQDQYIKLGYEIETFLKEEGLLKHEPPHCR